LYHVYAAYAGPSTTEIKPYNKNGIKILNGNHSTDIYKKSQKLFESDNSIVLSVKNLSI